MDPANFLDQAITGANSTRRIPVPKGEYPAIIKEIAGRTMDSKQKPGTIMYLMDVTFKIDDANAKAVTGLDEPTVRDTVFLEMDANGLIDKTEGKNIKLGRLREAVGQNDPNTEWKPSMLIGAACVVSVEHNPGTDPQDVYANVAKVGKLG